MPIDIASRIRGMIGLCAKAGCVSSGVESCITAIRKEKAALVILDEAASEQTKKSVRDACLYRNVALRELPADVLANAIGKPGRMAAAITHDGFASGILKLTDQQRDCGGAFRE